MIKIPLKIMNKTTFSDHGWRFGDKMKAFYITIDDKNTLYTKIGNSLSEQLLEILRQTTDSDRIKVIIYFLLMTKSESHFLRVLCETALEFST